MAEPIDSAVLLEDVSAIIQQQYMKPYPEQYTRFGNITNKMFKPATQIATGDGITMQTETGPSDTIRPSTDPLAPLASADYFSATTIKLRFDKRTPTNSDFVRFSGSAQTDDIDIENAGRGSIVDFVQRIYNQVVPDYEEKLAMLRHQGRTAALCTVNGTPKQNDDRVYSRCTATASNTAGMRVQISGGSPAYFKRNWRYDVYNSGTLIAGNIRCTDVNTADTGGPSMGFEFVSPGAGVLPNQQSTGNLASVLTAYTFYISGTKGAGIYSLGAYFSSPTTTDSFIGGVDRHAAANRYLVPQTTREDATSNSRITKSMFNDLAIAMQFRDEDGYGVVITSDLSLHQAMRDELGEQSFIQLPIGDERMKRFAHFGNIGLIYQHPAFGVVQITADPLHPANEVRVISTEDWRTYFYAFNGLKPVKEAGGHWYRMSESAPNSGRGLIWKADWYSLQADWCGRPWRNGRIANVAAT